MFDDLPPLSHQEQQQAVEKIQELMAKGTSTAEAIKIVAEQIRSEYAEKQQQQNQNPQTYNPDIVDWVRQNAWFNENSDDYDAEMADEVKAYDLVLSRQYQRMGKADKIATKDYFKDIDNYVREKFYMETPVTEPKVERKPFSKVSPVTNKPTGNSISEIRLSDTQKEIAQGLGMSEEAYRKAVINRINKNRGSK